MKLRNIAVFAAVAITVATFFGISGDLKAEAYTDVKEIYTKLMAAPSVIAEATDAETFEKMQNAVVKPASALFAYEDGKAEYCGGVAGELGDIKARLDESGILLVLRADDSASPEELAEKINAAKITDFSVMSGDVEFLSYVSEHTVGVRTVYDAAKKTVDDPHEYLSAARKGAETSSSSTKSNRTSRRRRIFRQD